MRRKKEAIKASLEIFLLVCSVFAFAYIIKNVDGKEVSLRIEKKSVWLGILKLFVGSIFSERTLVSALEGSDLQNGVATCPKGKDGSVCQEYPASECDSKCASTCYPATRDKTPGCKLGTCFDTELGTCQEGSPEGGCTVKKGKWFDNTGGNVFECQKACCVFGEQVRPLVTNRECEYIAKTRGVKTEFRTEIKNELACLALVGQQTEGACVFGEDSGKRCIFITKKECLESRGEFFEGIFCSNPALGMGYKKQASAGCVEGKDEIYWLDSEGNRENIYDSNEARSWNNGLILAKSKSCEMGSAQDPLKNQDKCGNCNRFLGSVCGFKTNKEKIPEIDVVCRSMRCVDKEGNARENGESWCEYQGDIGVEKGAGGFERSVDTPGSSHFRATCIDGEVQVNRCGEGYRNSVCIEQKNERQDGREISNAACVTNLWQLCLSYNSEVKGKGEERTRSLEERDKKCVENPHCLLKEVNIADNFKFDLCVPKYSPGFDLQKNPEGGELSCAFANQKCTVIKVKEIGGWKTKVNAGCLEPKFAEQMNDLCMSLGDCGASVNYMGDLTENYKVYKSPQLGESYLNGIKKYSDYVKGKYIEAGNITAYLNAIGGLELLGGKFEDPTPGGLGIAGTISGVSGVAIALGISSYAVTLGPALSAIGSALAGAAIGFAVTALLLQYTGVGAGLDPAITWSLIAAGTVGGAMAGLALGSTLFSGTFAGFGASLFGGAIGLGPVGLILIVIVIIVIVIFAALGIGDMKKIKVEFQCQPWQPVLGGAGCSKCGTDGYECSKYACQSLGQTCRLINEGTEEEKCVDISPNDIGAPRITPWDEALSSGFKYKETSDRGVKIASEENEGCLKANDLITFGIKLDEPGYCRFNIEHTSNFDSMLDGEKGGDLGGRNLFIDKHAHFFSVPDLTSLGVPGYDPMKKAEYNLYIRCIDGNGNGKDSAEYVINMCVKPGKDETPPVITLREPFKEFVKYGATKLDGAVYTNEPATCKWSLDSGKKYESMENKMECLNDVVDRELFGWKCNATFPVKTEENKFYIKCKDQPWYGADWEGERVGEIGVNESIRNEMANAYEFIVKRTKTELKIDSIRPDNETFVFGIVPATIILEARTSGGVDGRAACYLGEIKHGNEMGETFGNVHKQTFNQIMEGEYKFNVICEDEAGNTASAGSRFKVNIDDKPPIVTRAYEQGGELIIITNEEGECAFVKGGKEEMCGFDFANSTLMSGEGFRHSTSFEKGIYYIKCKDKWDKISEGCSIIVRGANNYE